MTTAQDPACILEIQRPVCDREFGVTCDATGDQCFNTWATCKDRCNYNCSVESLFISNCQVPPQYGITPAVQIQFDRVQRLPTKIRDNGLSTRGLTVIPVCDTVSTDALLDPYYPRDNSTLCAPDTKGSFWSRLLARQCWWRGIRSILHTGSCSIPFENYEREILFIQSIGGTPGRKGQTVNIQLEDPLFLLDGATCPIEEDFLTSNIVQNFNIQREPLYTGIILDGEPENDEDVANPNTFVGQTILAINYLFGDERQDNRFEKIRHVCVGSEIMRVRAEFNPANPAGWNLILLERGVCGTEIAEHEAGSVVTAAETFQDEHIVDVLIRLLRDCANIEEIAQACCGDEECLIDQAQFDRYRCENPLDIVCSEVVICKPKNVSEIIDNLSKVFGFDLFFNRSTGLIEIASSDCPDIPETLFTIEEKIVSGFKLKEIEQPISHVQFNHSPEDWSKYDEEDNLVGRTLVTTQDSLREPCDRRTIRVLNGETINTVWINACSEYIIKARGYRLLTIREKPTLEASMVLPLHVSKELSVGGYTHLLHSSVPHTTGEPGQEIWKVTSKSPGKICAAVTLQSTPYTGQVAKCIECPDSVIVDDAVDDCTEIDCLEIC